ncbi:hypothetical protein SAMN04488544_2247 [Microlunatus sagamiharensis]|uniref:Uncharacterized protein n=1 Tax=Microlunatus sagamiharensis TaxID=546874 RepID=A0A1H2MKI3_9ACTN|nr:hypothetical protein [Microlunatus sagamiharensis]SDU93709.1 hypothetical protein SAMN04488544_2247 [Microlunatus sagamiharensis]
MRTPWRRFAVFGVAFVVLGAVNLARVVGGIVSATGLDALSLVGTGLMSVLAVLFLRQAVLRRRANGGRRRSP